jgi:hypothetical protein
MKKLSKVGVSREEIYDQIIVDLNFAKENLQKDNASLSRKFLHKVLPMHC